MDGVNWCHRHEDDPTLPISEWYCMHCGHSAVTQLTEDLFDCGVCHWQFNRDGLPVQIPSEPKLTGWQALVGTIISTIVVCGVWIMDTTMRLFYKKSAP